MNDRVAQLLLALGLRGWHVRVVGLGSIGLCLSLWVRAKTIDQQERGNAERRAIFVGLWPPTHVSDRGDAGPPECAAGGGGR